MSTLSPHSEARGRLLASIDELGADELDVLAAMARRLRRGLAEYGPLQIDTDARDWAKERLEELEDALVYSMIDTVKRARSGGA